MIILSRKILDGLEVWYEAAQSAGAILLIDKELGWTSFDAVARIRNALRLTKVGHAGTLDPLATGLLILCCGKATKRADEFQALPKQYRTNIKLGATTKTFDSEGDEENIKPLDGITSEHIMKVVESFVGDIEQVPPMYSALKVNGQRLYKLARKGEKIAIGSRPVSIHSITSIEVGLPFVNFDVSCSKGTYIRSLANDIGEKLGCGGYMHSLRRTKIGDFDVHDALKVAETVTLIKDMKTAKLEKQNTEHIRE